MTASLAGRTLARPAFETAFAAPAFIGAMLDFEEALALAQAEEGLFEIEAAQTIAKACAGIHLDVEALVAEAKRSATIAIPMVRLLREEVKRINPAHASRLHFGATSQDVLDTAMVLCLKPCLEEADRTLETVVRSLARLALEHHHTPMLGRTLMQPAVPICAHAIAAATRMPGLLASMYAAAAGEHERALGSWQAESSIVPEIAGALGSCLDFLDVIGDSLVINAARMESNVATYGEGVSPARVERAVAELLAELSPYINPTQDNP